MGDMTPEEFMELMDIADQAVQVGFLTPREYAKLKGMSPQLVYYYIRNKVIETEQCRCGRTILSVVQADEALAEKARQRGKVLDTRPDDERDDRQGSDLQEMSPSDLMEEPDDDI